jgi:hypothetical protein
MQEIKKRLSAVRPLLPSSPRSQGLLVRLSAFWTMGKAPQPTNHFQGLMVESWSMEMRRPFAMQFLRAVRDLPVAIAIVYGYVDQLSYLLTGFFEYSNWSSGIWHTGKLLTLGRHGRSLIAVFEITFQDLPSRTNRVPHSCPLGIRSDHFHDRNMLKYFLPWSSKIFFTPCILGRKWTTCWVANRFARKLQLENSIAEVHEDTFAVQNLSRGLMHMQD